MQGLSPSDFRLKCKVKSFRFLFEMQGLSPLDFCLVGWMKSECYKREADTQAELLASSLYAAVRIEN
jgi:hypothetical protein